MGNNKKGKKHDFHMVLRNDLKIRILNLSEELGKNLSGTALYILERSLCILKKYHYDIEEVEEISTYQYIDWDEDLHIFMDEILYRKIKHLADTMFAFSIAIVIRKLFKLYFDMLKFSKGKKDRVERVFKRFYSIHVKKYGNNLIYWKKCLIQKQLYGEFLYFLEFNDKFSITGFNYLKNG